MRKYGLTIDQLLSVDLIVVAARQLAAGSGRVADRCRADVRHEVEFSPLPTLPRLAHEALELTDLICRATLEQGDADGFCRCVATAIALRDLAEDAGLLP